MNVRKETKVSISWNLYNFFAILAVLAFVYALWVARTSLLMIFVAIIISLLIEDFVQKWEHYGIHRLASVMIFYFILVAVLSLTAFFIIPVIVKEMGSLADIYPQLGTLVNNSSLHQFIQYVSQEREGLSLGTVSLSKLPFDTIFAGLSTLFGGVINLIIVFVVSFYMSIQKHGFDRILKLITPKHYEKSVIKIWKNIQHKIGGWFRGQLIIAGILILITYIGLSLLGIHYALLLSLLAGLFGLIPYGIILALIPAVGIASIYGGWKLGFFVVIFYLVVQQFLDYIIQPLIVKRMTGVPPLMVILSVILGAQIFGFVGIIIAVPLALIALEIIHTIEEEKEKGVSRIG